MTKKTDYTTLGHPDRSIPKHVTAGDVISEVFNHIFDDDADLCFSTLNMPVDVNYALTIRLRDLKTCSLWRLFHHSYTISLDQGTIVDNCKSSINEIQQHTIRHNQPTLTFSSYESLSWNAINL
jgi:hypothetical protein